MAKLIWAPRNPGVDHYWHTGGNWWNANKLTWSGSPPGAGDVAHFGGPNSVNENCLIGSGNNALCGSLQAEAGFTAQLQFAGPKLTVGPGTQPSYWNGGPIISGVTGGTLVIQDAFFFNRADLNVTGSLGAMSVYVGKAGGKPVFRVTSSCEATDVLWFVGYDSEGNPAAGSLLLETTQAGGCDVNEKTVSVSSAGKLLIAAGAIFTNCGDVSCTGEVLLYDGASFELVSGRTLTCAGGGTLYRVGVGVATVDGNLKFTSATLAMGGGALGYSGLDVLGTLTFQNDAEFLFSVNAELTTRCTSVTATAVVISSASAVCTTHGKNPSAGNYVYTPLQGTVSFMGNFTPPTAWLGTGKKWTETYPFTEYHLAGTVGARALSWQGGGGNTLWENADNWLDTGTGLTATDSPDSWSDCTFPAGAPTTCDLYGTEDACATLNTESGWAGNIRFHGASLSVYGANSSSGGDSTIAGGQIQLYADMDGTVSVDDENTPLDDNPFGLLPVPNLDDGLTACDDPLVGLDVPLPTLDLEESGTFTYQGATFGAYAAGGGLPLSVLVGSGTTFVADYASFGQVLDAGFRVGGILDFEPIPTGTTVTVNGPVTVESDGTLYLGSEESGVYLSVVVNGVVAFQAGSTYSVPVDLDVLDWGTVIAEPGATTSGATLHVRAQGTPHPPDWQYDFLILVSDNVELTLGTFSTVTQSGPSETWTQLNQPGWQLRLKATQT